MSTNLYWQPAPKPRKPKQFDQLKFVIAPHLFDHDGSLRSDPVVVDGTFLAFLRGVVAATSNDSVRREAIELINAIEKYGDIELWTDD